MLVASIVLWSLVYCDLGNAQMEGFIVGGEETTIQEYPHSAFISVKCVKKKEVFEWICGSSIVHRSVLLTAAHCLDGCSKDSVITAAVGDEHRARGYKNVASRFLIHKHYDNEVIKNDIGMTMLVTPVVLSSKVKLAILPKNRPRSQTAFVAGWGLIDEIRRKESEMMKYAKQNVYSKNYCLDLLHNIPDGSICAGNTYNNDYVSEGDSGSALVIQDGSPSKAKIMQIGIVSYKYPDVSRSISVFTDIPYFYDWIQSRIKKILKQSAVNKHV